MMQAMMDLREMLCKELDEHARKGELSAGSLETVHKLTDTIKNIDKIMMLEGEDGYSGGDGEWTAKGNYSRGNYSRDSYRNGMYSGTGYSGRHYVRGHYSRAEGADMVRERINEMMRDGSMSGEERNILNRAMQIISDR